MFKQITTLLTVSFTEFYTGVWTKKKLFLVSYDIFQQNYFVPIGFIMFSNVSGKKTPLRIFCYFLTTKTHSMFVWTFTFFMGISQVFIRSSFFPELKSHEQFHLVENGQTISKKPNWKEVRLFLLSALFPYLTTQIPAIQNLCFVCRGMNQGDVIDEVLIICLILSSVTLFILLQPV